MQVAALKLRFHSLSCSPSGLSDPFVIVELCPHHLFPMAKSQRTQVKLKTLHPVFDELFYLWDHFFPLFLFLFMYVRNLSLIRLVPSVFLATSVLNSTDTGLPVWPSLWWTTTGFPPTTSLVKPWLLSATSAGQGDRTPRPPERASSRSFCTCLAVNPVVHITPGCISFFPPHKHNIGFCGDQRV